MKSLKTVGLIILISILTGCIKFGEHECSCDVTYNTSGSTVYTTQKESYEGNKLKAKRNCDDLKEELQNSSSGVTSVSCTLTEK